MKTYGAGGQFVGPAHWRKPRSASGPGWYYRDMGGLKVCIVGGDNKTRVVEIPAKEILKYADELRKVKKESLPIPNPLSIVSDNRKGKR